MSLLERWWQLRSAPDIHRAGEKYEPSWRSTARHLLWSVWVLIVPLFNAGYDLRWALMTLVTYPLFLTLYIASTRRPRRRLGVSAIAMIMLGLVSLPGYPSGATYYVYGCILLPRANWRLPVYLASLLGACAMMIVVGDAAGLDWQSLLSISVVASVASLSVVIESMHRAHEAARRLSQAEIERLAVTAERERIGRDLHDLLGSTLSSIALRLEVSERLFDQDRARVRAEIVSAQATARDALAEVRAAVTGFRRSGLAIELAAAKLRLQAVPTVLDYTLPAAPLPEAVEKELALIARELLTNVARHAAARRAVVAFEQHARGLTMTVRDDGQGSEARPGNGLAGVSQRVSLLGGALYFDTVQARGTTVRIDVPLAEEARADEIALCA